MKLDKSHPCPHCGKDEVLEKDREIKSILPDDLQPNFEENISELANRSTNLTFEELYGDVNSIPNISSLIREYPGIEKTKSKLLSLNLPLEFLFPHMEHVTLDPASLKVYFQLAVEQQIILKSASTYQEGMHRWSVILPDRLQEYGLTTDSWDQITSIGDNDPIIQGELRKILAAVGV